MRIMAPAKPPDDDLSPIVEKMDILKVVVEGDARDYIVVRYEVCQTLEFYAVFVASRWDVFFAAQIRIYY